MAVLVTGCAGFVGMHVSEALLAQGEAVLGIDNLNAYYDPALKRARLARLEARPGFSFARADLAEAEAIRALLDGRSEIASVVHLGAQAGVRHSLEQPFDYVRSNLVGQIVVLEACRRWLPNVRHLVYASSSSVYGGNRKVPFTETDPTDHPVSLYAATKRADELLSHSYSHLYGLPATGLRFFTVYGPWGRPDMAYYLFTDAIARGEPVTLYNDGEMRRDFTYIDDAVDGVLAALARPPAPRDGAPHAIYNLGNSRPVPLKRFLEIIEGALGRTAEVRLAGMPPGDVLATWADPELSRRELGFEPKVPLEEGLARFVAWYREYHAL